MTDAPAFQSFTTSRGARVFAIPLEAFPSFYAYAYLVCAGDTFTLIDAGSGSERSHADLEAGFQQASAALGKSVTFADLTHVLITHGHIDHFGGISKLRELTKARIGIHELDYQTVAHHETRLAIIGRRLENFLEQAGVDPESRADLLRTYRFTKGLYHSVQVDFTFEAAGQKIGDYEWIHLPGHCPGQVAIKLDDVVFCGDHVIENVTPHQSPEELTPFLGIRHYLESLSIFARWAEGARFVLGGHGQIQNLETRMEEIRANLNHRLRQTLEAFREPNTVAAACRQVYGEIGGYNALLVIEKTGAYVEYLSQRGLLEICNLNDLEADGNPVIQYRCSNPNPEMERIPKERADVLV
ncbi:MAG: MBL fold metallo-hydrolase [Chloroflexi bacterium]|nr:MBL fold metallo-hydrolase [Chloroflexota bacterium]